MIYIEIVNGKPTRSTRFLNIAVNYKNRIETTYSDYTCSNNKYVYDKASNSIIINPNFKSEQAQKEAERIAHLSLTRGDVLRGLLLAKGVTKEQISQMIEAMPTSSQEQIVVKELAKIDFEDALNFYRGVPLIDTIGLQLGFTKEQLDKFFDTNDYRYLTTCKLKVNAIPEDAVIEINSEIQSEITVPYGSTVDIVVSCEGYISRKDVLTLTEDRTLEVVLDEDTTGSDTTDISDEVDTAPDTAEKADADNAG